MSGLGQLETDIINYSCVSVFLIICMGIGIYHGWKGRGHQTPEEYLLGNRKLRLFPVALSLFVTFQSAISLMGVPAEMYLYGTMMLYMYGGLCTSLIAASFTIVPLIHPLGITSAFEYLELRFQSRSVRLLGTLTSMLQTIIYMGITLYAPGLALQTVANIPLWSSIVIVGGVGIVYTCIGGIKSVVWTDVFQCFIIFGGTLAILLKQIFESGDPGEFARIVTDGKRIKFDDGIVLHAIKPGLTTPLDLFCPAPIQSRDNTAIGLIHFLNFDPRVRHTVWSLVVGGFFTWLSSWCSQSSIQRISSVRNQLSAKFTYIMSIPFSIVYGALMGTLGLVLYAFYNQKQCDPLEAGYINNANQLMPYFVFDVMKPYPGLPGIYISALFSGSLSTVSSGINSLAANTVEDLLKHKLANVSKFKVTLVAKFTVIIFGGIAIGIAYLAQTVPGPVTQISLATFGACGGPVTGLFFLGGLFPFANWIGAFVGGFVSLILNLWLSIGATLYGRKADKLDPNPTIGCIDYNTTLTDYNMTMTTTELMNTSLFNNTTSNSGLSSPTTNIELYNISYMWYGMIGFILTIVIGVVVSCITGGSKRHKTEPKYLFVFCRRFLEDEDENKHFVNNKKEPELLNFDTLKDGNKSNNVAYEQEKQNHELQRY